MKLGLAIGLGANTQGEPAAATGPIQDTAPSTDVSTAKIGTAHTLTAGTYSARGGGSVVVTTSELRVDGVAVANPYTPDAGDDGLVLSIYELATETGGTAAGTTETTSTIGTVGAAASLPTVSLFEVQDQAADGDVAIHHTIDIDHTLRVVASTLGQPTAVEITAGQELGGASAPIAYSATYLAGSATADITLPSGLVESSNLRFWIVPDGGADGDVFEATYETGSSVNIDTTVPTVASSDDGLTDFSLTGSFIINMDDDMAEVGTVTVRDVTGAADEETFDLSTASSGVVTGSNGNTLTFGAASKTTDRLTLSFSNSALPANSNGYAIHIESATDTNGNGLTDIVDDTTFNFTTVAASSSPPVVEGIQPSSNNVDGTVVSLGFPAGMVVGELLVAFPQIEAGVATAQFSDNHADWNFVSTVGDQNVDVHQGVFWRIVTGDEGVTVDADFDAVTSAQTGGFIVRISGAHATLPIHLSGTDVEGNVSPKTVTGLTSTIDDCLALAALTFDGGEGYPFALSAGWTKESDYQAGTSSSSISGVLASKDMPTAGPTGDLTITPNGSEVDGSAFAMLLIRSVA